MRRLLLLCWLFSASAPALDYQFTPPEFPADQAGLQFHYYLPAKDSFASNINLISQAYAGSIEAYDGITRAQFEQYDFDILRAEIRGNEAVYEYQGNFQDRKLYWYARAVKRGAFVYLITATCPQSRADAEGPELRAAVDSFRLN